MVCIGTRAEAIKVAPLIKCLRQLGDSRIQSQLCVTGQHLDLMNSALQSSQISPDYELHLEPTATSIVQLTATVMKGVEVLLRSVEPDLVLVQGDTASSLGSAVAASLNGIPICHLEAGLRSGSKREPFPEEIFRTLLTDLASFHFAPNERARDNLLKENVDSRAIFLTGNTIEDALALELNRQTDPIINLTSEIQALRRLVVTVHRRENIGSRTKQICTAVSTLAATHPNLQVYFVLHPNPKLRVDIMSTLQDCARVRLLEPLPHNEFISLLRTAQIVLTDSGGVSEESALLGLPLFICREATESPHLIETGAAILTGTSSQSIVQSVTSFMNGETKFNLNTTFPPPERDPLTVSHKVIEAIATNILPGLVG